MLNYHPCFLYLAPWFIAFFLTMIFVTVKKYIPHYKYYWLNRLLQLLGGVFVIIGGLSLPIPAMIGLNVSLFGAGSLMINFTVIAEIADNKPGSKNNEV